MARRKEVELKPVIIIDDNWYTDPKQIWNDAIVERKYQNILRSLLRAKRYTEYKKLVSSTAERLLSFVYLEIAVRYGNYEIVKFTGEYFEKIEGRLRGANGEIYDLESEFEDESETSNSHNLLLNNYDLEINRYLIELGMSPKLWHINVAYDAKRYDLVDLFVEVLFKRPLSKRSLIDLYRFLKKLNYHRGVGIIFNSLPEACKKEWTLFRGESFIVF